MTVGTNGMVRAVYTDAVPFRALGKALGALEIRRGSHVEPTGDGRWTADLGPSGGPVLGPFDRRADALAEELSWLDRHLLEGAA